MTEHEDRVSQTQSLGCSVAPWGYYNKSRTGSGFPNRFGIGSVRSPKICRIPTLIITAVSTKKWGFFRGTGDFLVPIGLFYPKLLMFTFQWFSVYNWSIANSFGSLRLATAADTARAASTGRYKFRGLLVFVGNSRETR